MKRHFLFLILFIICILLIIPPYKESFQINVPDTKPYPTPLGKGDPLPLMNPYAPLVSPPPGQLASVNSYPASNPVFQKAPLRRLKEIQEMQVGFLVNEAPGILEIRPNLLETIQNIVQQRNKLETDIVVMERNEGLESRFTQGDLNEMEKGVASLQSRWRLSPNTIEGFQTPADVSVGPGPGMAQSTNLSVNTGKINLMQLKEILLKVNVEILRLS